MIVTKKGEKSGMKQGAKEKAIEIARKLKAKNTDIEEIEITGLTVEEIEMI